MADAARQPWQIGRIFGQMAVVLAAALALSACGRLQADPPTEYKEIQRGVSLPREEYDKVTGGKMFGENGISLLGRDDDKSGGGGGGIGVNAFLWRASLDTISFMPLSSADPFGGVIITDWFSPQQSPDERCKVTVYILDTRLRADGVKVALFKQQRDAGRATWLDGRPGANAAADIENAILTRARELRIASNTK